MDNLKLYITYILGNDDCMGLMCAAKNKQDAIKDFTETLKEDYPDADFSEIEWNIDEISEVGEYKVKFEKLK